MVFIIATSYLLGKRILKPAITLTHQLTLNRTHIYRKVESSYTFHPLNESFLPRKDDCVLVTKARLQCIIIWKYIQNSLALTMRTSQLIILFGPVFLVGIPLYLVGGLSMWSLSRWVRWSLSSAGATFTKLGQWAATRPDVLPDILCTELAKLHSNAPAHNMAWNKKAILLSFGKQLDDIFEEFDPRPIGSGTIAQVHRAKLKIRGNARDSVSVAVKITHPNIEEAIHRDLLLLKAVARVFHTLFPPLRWISFPEEVSVFSKMMEEQVDLRFEAFTLQRFNQNFEGTEQAWGNLPRIKFPRPKTPWASRFCLVEELIEDSIPIGFILNTIPGINPVESKGLREDLAVLGLKSFMQMLLWDNFVHADLHPGNILVKFVERQQGSPINQSPVGEIFDSLKRRMSNLFWSVERLMVRIVTPGPLPPNPREPITIKRLESETDFDFLMRQVGNPKSLVQLVILDTGLVTELSKTDFLNFTDLFQALVLQRDGYRAGELMIDRAPEWSRLNVKDREGFCLGLREVVRPIFPDGSVVTDRLTASTSLKHLRLDVVLHKLFELARKHHVRIDAAYTNLVMSLLCVEGLGRQMAPEMNLRPLLAQAALQYLIKSV